MVVLLVVYLLVVHSYLYGLQDVHFDSGWHSLLVQLFCLPAPVLQGQRPAGPSAHNCCTYLHKCFTTHKLHIIIVALTHSCTGALPLMIITLSLSAQRSSQIIPSSETLHWKPSQVKFCPTLALWPFTFLDSLVDYFCKSESASREKRMRLWPRSLGGGAWLLPRSGRVSQTKEERYSYQHWVAGAGGRVGSWPTRSSSISISREQGHQQNCVQRRGRTAMNWRLACPPNLIMWAENSATLTTSQYCQLRWEPKGGGQKMPTSQLVTPSKLELGTRVRN